MSWDTANCTEGYARDTLFPSSTPPSSSFACDLNIDFFNAYVAMLLFLQFAMLVMRTRFIVQHAKKQKRKLVLSQYITIMLTFIPLVALLLMLILPNFSSSYPQGNVMYLLFGILLGVAQINMIRWVWKLRRLGYKLIVKRLPGMKDTVMSATNADKTERLTVILVIGSYFVALAFVTVSCIVGMLIPNNGTLVQASFGLFGVYIVQMLIGGLNQTEHCCWLISTTMHNVQNIIEPSMVKKYHAVLDKFRHQEMIMLIFGITGIVLCILVAANVVPAKQEIFLLFVTFDVLSAFSMMASILGYCFVGAFKKETSSSIQQQQQQLKTHSSKVVVLPGTAEDTVPRT